MAIKVAKGDILSAGDQIGRKSVAAGQHNEAFIHKNVIVLVFKHHMPIDVRHDLWHPPPVRRWPGPHRWWFHQAASGPYNRPSMVGLNLNQPADLKAIDPPVPRYRSADGLLQLFNPLFQTFHATGFLLRGFLGKRVNRPNPVGQPHHCHRCDHTKEHLYASCLHRSIAPCESTHRSTGRHRTPRTRDSLFFVERITRKGLQPGRPSIANPSAGFRIETKRPRRRPSLLDGDLRGLDLRIIRFLKSKRQTSVCPLNMSHIPTDRSRSTRFLGPPSSSKRTRRSWQCECTLPHGYDRKKAVQPLRHLSTEQPLLRRTRVNPSR